MPTEPEKYFRPGDNLGIGLEIAAGVGLGLLVGWWLDGKFGWKPWGMIIGAMVGLAGGMYLLIKQAINMDKGK